MARVYQCFVELDAELGNMVANHARALEGYFPPVVNLKKVRTEIAMLHNTGYPVLKL